MILHGSFIHSCKALRTTEDSDVGAIMLQRAHGQFK